MDIFKLNSITAGYDNSIILKNIDLTINKSDFISIIGPNGSGKTTLIKLLSGRIKPESGEIFFKGNNFITHDNKKLAMELSVVDQFTESILNFTVYNFIRMGRYPHQKIWGIESKEDREIIINALEITGTVELKDRFLNELSGGELQLIFIAKAFAQTSEIILLDEPVSHLDIKHSVRIMDILYKLNCNGSTIISILHDINLVSNYCNRVVGLKDGNISFDGQPEDKLTIENLSTLFDTNIIVEKNRVSGKPLIYNLPMRETVNN